MTATRFAELLAALAAGGVSFVLVGGLAAALTGATYSTDDVDIVPDLSPENLERLLGVLGTLDARYRDAAQRVIRPDRQHLSVNRINLLDTSLGRLDILRSVGPGWAYDDLLSRSIEVSVGGNATRVLSLEALIEAKEAADRPKDRAQLPLLRETLRLARLKAGE